MRLPLFTYGTLQAQEIIESITGLQLQREPAGLSGFACYRVKNALYPGIIPQARKSVTGTVFSGLHDQALQQLDHFEGPLYTRETVTIFNDKRQLMPAWAYVIKPSCRHVLTRELWCYETYETQFIARFRRYYSV